MENIVITNQEKFEQIKSKMKKGVAEALHILADFDRALTKMFVNGKKVWSLQGVLRETDILPKEYSPKAQELFNYYYPLETDSSLTNQEKKRLMDEWWGKAFDLMIDFEFNKSHLQAIVDLDLVKFREGTEEFLEILNKNNVPLVIISASGVGEAIEPIFKKQNFLFDNIFIIANSLEWNKQDLAIKPKLPIVHSLNKDEILVKSFSDIFSKVENRKNIILLGDNPEDIGMAQGFEYENIIKLGF